MWYMDINSLLLITMVYFSRKVLGDGVYKYISCTSSMKKSLSVGTIFFILFLTLLEKEGFVYKDKTPVK